jgi:N-acetylglucosaminyldiphosphoundecaprenol N-acetyl-beta-D-mannosaminyltransferase
MPIDGAAPAPGRIEFLHVGFDPIDLNGATDWLRTRSADDPFAYVVTPNVDHVIRIVDAPSLSRLYDRAALCLNDSRVLARMAGWEQIHLPLATGSDLTMRLFDEVLRPGDAVLLVGCMPDEAETLSRRFPAFRITHLNAPMGLRQDPEARARVAEQVARTSARFILLAIGSPQQELIAGEISALATATGTALCIGASVEFLLGTRARAPAVIQAMSLEWAWRLSTEPRKLWRRYLIEAPRIFPIFQRWRRKRR